MFRRINLIQLLFSLVISMPAFSQDIFPRVIPYMYNLDLFDSANFAKKVKKDSVSQKDITDLPKIILPGIKAKVCDTTKPIKGKFMPSFFPAIGYTQVSGWLVSATANLSVYTDNPDSTKLSVIKTGGEYSLKHQTITWFITNFWTKNNKIDFIGDCRYYIFPSNTYGLGTNTSLNNADPIDYSYLKIYEEVLRRFGSFYAGGGYDLDYHYNIKALSENTDFQNYNQGAASTTSSGLAAHVKYDTRINMNNSTDANYVSVTYRYNSTLLGSSNDWQYVLLEATKYIPIGKTKSVIAFWTWNEFTFGCKAPYFDLPNNGWDTYGNTGRGYIQSRFRGKDMVYLESEYRFPITKNGLLGGVVFVNCESESQWPSNKFEYLAPGEGLGLRIKMNRQSKVNLCIDYGFGILGSRGFFFNLGEVF